MRRALRALLDIFRDLGQLTTLRAALERSFAFVPGLAAPACGRTGARGAMQAIGEKLG